MRLKSLYIDNYKNIKRQTFDFSKNNGYIALIGLNGSGKSNLLEAISLIFNGLYNKKKIPFQYEIVYEHEGKTYSRKSRMAKIDERQVRESQMFYPSSVIACYSGEDLRLWYMAFEDYHMHYFKKAIDDKVQFPNLLYINKYCWNIALIALMYSEDKNIKRFLNEELDIVDLEEVEVSFEFAKPDKFKEHQALRWINRIKDECLDETGKATLKALLSYDVPLLPNQTKESCVFLYLYLLSQPKKNEEKGNDIDKYITKLRVDKKGINTSCFSEGHKKLILIKCITSILGNEKSLLLLDEPDAHVHIALKKEILDCVKNFGGQTVLTTHAPVFVNAIYKQAKESLYFMEDGALANSDCIDSLIKLSSGEIDFLNGSIVLNAKNILVTEGPYDKRYLEKAIAVQKNANRQYEKFDYVTIISSGSAGNSLTFYEQVLKPQIRKYDKIVFLFDYDKGGLDGWKKIKAINSDKVIPIFYQENYDNNYDTAKSDIASEATYMVEDLFSPEAYREKVEYVHRKNTHKDFRCNTQGKTADSIKKHIENNYQKFEDVWYDGFRPILDKLLELYGLN